MSEKPSLAERMFALADKGHPRAEEMREKATEFQKAVDGYYSEPPTVEAKSFLGAYARARKLWCEITGEPLV